MKQFPDPELADHLENLDKSVPSNITVQMGLELFELWKTSLLRRLPTSKPSPTIWPGAT